MRMDSLFAQCTIDAVIHFVPAGSATGLGALGILRTQRPNRMLDEHSCLGPSSCRDALWLGTVYVHSTLSGQVPQDAVCVLGWFLYERNERNKVNYTTRLDNPKKHWNAWLAKKGALSPASESERDRLITPNLTGAVS